MKRRRNLIAIIGLVAFVTVVGGVSYSYFVYNRNIADMSLDTGSISINLADISGNLTLSNSIPMTDYEGVNSATYVDFTVTGTVDTDKIYYEVYMLPKNDNTLDTAYIRTYLTDQTNGKYSEVTPYNNLPNSEKTGGKTLYKGLIDINSNGTTKNYSRDFRLRLWANEDLPVSTPKTFGFDLYVYAYNVTDVNANNISYGNDSNCNTVQCQIEGLNSPFMRLSTRSGAVARGGTITSTIITNGDGALSCESSNPSNATCSISGTTLTISGVSVGNAIITVSQDEGTNYLAPTDVTYNVTVTLPAKYYYITNLATNGSFENDFLNCDMGTTDGCWGNHGPNECYQDNKHTKYSNYSFRIYTDNAQAFARARFFGTGHSLQGHKIYARVSSYRESSSCVPGLYLMSASEAHIWATSTESSVWYGSYWSDINAWHEMSAFYEADYNYLIVMLAQSDSTCVGSYYFDGLVVVDLTATFGQGNEPTKEWCDQNISYFDGTAEIYKA